jgi:hypothetical protein
MANPDRKVHASETCIAILVLVIVPLLLVIGTIRLVWP